MYTCSNKTKQNKIDKRRTLVRFDCHFQSEESYNPPQTSTMALFDSSFTDEDFEEHSNDHDFLLALQLHNQLNPEHKQEKSQKSVEQVENTIRQSFS